MPEKVFEKLNKWILPQWKICFLAAVTVGMIAHLYKLTGWLPNWDSLVFRYDAQNMLGLGRWFLPVACALSSFYDLPFLNGLVAIIYHALGAVCICEILHVRKNATAFLIGAFVVSMPTVTSVLMYNYVADGYGLAFFLACMAAVCLTEEKPKYIAATVLITLSVAIYQAYITITVMLLLLSLTDGLIYKKQEAKKTVVSGLKYLATGVAGMLLYTAILNLLLKITGTEMLSYQGLDSAASMSGVNVFESLYVIKETFIGYFFDFSNGINLLVILNIAVFAITVFMYLKYAVKSGIFTSPVKIAMLLILGAFLLLGANVLAFIDSGIDYHNLMLMGYCVFYIFFVILYERGEDLSKKHKMFKSWVVLGLGAVLIFNHIVIANVSWHKAQMAYEKSYGTLIRIADRIEQTEGALECKEILVVGALDGSEAYSVNLPPDITGITNGYILRRDDETVGQSVLCSALNDYCEKQYDFIAGERKEELLKRAEIKSMNQWPLEGCVDVVEGVIVIKLGSGE